jgi:hypothetical protein
VQIDEQSKQRAVQAEHYIFIENQYFLGSSHCWESDRHAGATHLVPIEIALKIVSKINDGERFMAYIVIPLFPEGAPPQLSSCSTFAAWRTTAGLFLSLCGGQQAVRRLLLSEHGAADGLVACMTRRFYFAVQGQSAVGRCCSLQ